MLGDIERMKPQAAILAALLVGIAGAVRADVVVGVAAPAGGALAPLGAQMLAGVTEAAAAINADGGVNGETLVVEMLDDGCEPKRADAVANQFAGRGATLVVGHLCLTASLAAAPVYAANRIIQISPATTFPGYTDNRAGPGTFRLAGRDDQQGVIAGHFLAERFGDQRIAIVDDMSPYGKGLADATRRAMNQAGIKEVMTEAFEPGAANYDAMIGRLRATNIDVLYIGGFYPDAATIARGLSDAGMTTIVVGGDALMTEEYWRAAGDAADGTLVSFMPDPSLDPNNATLVAALPERGVTAEGYVLYAYAAVQAWAAAANVAGSNDFDAVASALAVGAFDTALGPVSFDQKGDATLPSFVFYQWNGGAYTMAGF